MPVAEAIRSWKDEDFLMSLNDADRALLPENPAGRVELGGWDPAGDKELNAITFFKQCQSIVIECSASNCGI